MTWKTSLLLKKRKNGPQLGFKNLDNTCYLNIVLQCLTYTPPLANFYLQLQHSENCEFLAQQDKKSGCPFCLLEKRTVRSLSIDSTLDTPGKIIGGLKVFDEHFCLWRNEDAHEFLRSIKVGSDDKLRFDPRKSEYVHCMHLVSECELYVATNNGFLYLAKISYTSDVAWTQLFCS
uniref:ubiquitinyl hydrolase 1 n=1 Tax=Lactuca sativa TaxID=4236 RepID=A0A9R1XEP7_LACSA|nr:hypothetical protein LSAT_V11C400165960 [Lactuca sativa]